MSHAKKIIESVLSNKPYSVKTAVNEAMAERIGLILEQELERLGVGLLTEKEGKDMDGDGDIDSKDYLENRNKVIDKAIEEKKKKKK